MDWEWILSNSDVTVDQRKQCGVGSVMIGTGIVDQTIIGLFQDDERVKLNSTDYYVILENFFFHGTNPSLSISK